MKLPFLYEEIKNSTIDEKEQILEALVTHDWKIVSMNTFTSVNANHPVVDLESTEGFWLNNIPLDLFPKEVLAEELIRYQPCFD